MERIRSHTIYYPHNAVVTVNGYKFRVESWNSGLRNEHGERIVKQTFIAEEETLHA